MRNKITFFFAFLSFLIVGCDSIGGVNLTDTKGSKYTFKNGSVTCERIFESIYCEGAAIKTDIAGKRYAVDFERRYCKSAVRKKFWGGDILCDAAKELGKFVEFEAN